MTRFSSITNLLIAFVLILSLPLNFGSTRDGKQGATINLPLVTANFSPPIQIAAGGFYTCLLTRAGGVKCWGANSFGNLGDGTLIESSIPVNVAGLSSGVAAISVGGASCALTTRGGVKCWGLNRYGNLGDGSTTNRPTPVDVVGLTSGVLAIAAGGGHTCALTTTGGVKCWGDNEYGQLGDGTKTSRSTPVDVAGLSSGMVSIFASYYSTCALTRGGGAKCWGVNPGDGKGSNALTPVDVFGLSSGVASISPGYDHTCAVTTHGKVKCWGDNTSGQLGVGNIILSPTPVDATNLTSSIISVALGWYYTCALTVSGGVKCWGDNSHGMLGDGTTSKSTLPIDVFGLSSGVIAITAGVYFTCALISGGGAMCWGDDEDGQLGNGLSITRATPVTATGLSSAMTAVGAGFRFTCGLTGEGGVKCWGRNLEGQIGDGTTMDRWTPVDVVGLSSGVASIAVGAYSSCALTVGGGVKCWGFTSNAVPWSYTPVGIPGLSSGVVGISIGAGQACALTSVGGVKCWGDNQYGQLGDGTLVDRTNPVDVVGLSSGVTAIDAGWYHTCARTTAGAVQCWGYNQFGQLGDGTTTTRLTPVDVVGLSYGAVDLSAGEFHTCSLTAGGGVKC